jgi:DNA-binding response OmpR family regulator
MRLLYVADRRVDAYLVNALREAGHVIDATGDAADGLEMAGAEPYQVIVLDWSAPSTGSVIRFAAAASGALLMVIAAHGDDAERTAVLAAGGDACFIRPVSFIELAARLEALARLVQRTHLADAPVVELMAAERVVRLNGRSTPLSGREFQLMALLADHPGEVIDLNRLGRQISREDAEPRPDLARACLGRLRGKLEAAGAHGVLRAIAGHGYLFDPSAIRLEEARRRAPLSRVGGRWLS